MITGQATIQGTTDYSKAHNPLRYNELNRTGLLVSQAGFGCYRVDISVDSHRKALSKALLNGINLVDTSSNYSDGGSEKLVGSVVAELIETGKLLREALVIVSKGGYLQGQNYDLSQKRKREGKPFQELVLYQEGLEHCIHPEFLEDQITRSLERLNMPTIDIYLLHNPEYYLGWAKKSGISASEARREYYRRLELAFRHLEAEVEKRRIQFYGISSNTFPEAATEFEFTSLETVWKIAESISANHHFKVIQLPMNLFETGGITEKNQSNHQSDIEFAKNKDLGVLINRPLNAIVGDTLTRLADVSSETPASPEEVESLINDLIRPENQIKNMLLPSLDIENSVRGQLAEFISAGEILRQYWRRFGTYEHWRDLQSQYLVPRIQGGVQYLLQLENLSAKARSLIERYVEAVNATFQAIASFYKVAAAKKVAEIKAKVASADSDWGSAATLSQMAIRALRSTPGITTVLVGMRQEAYVDDVIAELSKEVEIKDRNKPWGALKA